MIFFCTSFHTTCAMCTLRHRDLHTRVPHSARHKKHPPHFIVRWFKISINTGFFLVAAFASSRFPGRLKIYWFSFDISCEFGDDSGRVESTSPCSKASHFLPTIIGEALLVTRSGDNEDFIRIWICECLCMFLGFISSFCVPFPPHLHPVLLVYPTLLLFFSHFCRLQTALGWAFSMNKKNINFLHQMLCIESLFLSPLLLKLWIFISATIQHTRRSFMVEWQKCKYLVFR